MQNAFKQQYYRKYEFLQINLQLVLQNMICGKFKDSTTDSGLLYGQYFVICWTKCIFMTRTLKQFTLLIYHSYIQEQKAAWNQVL